jgi:hypothetical protein
MARHLALGIASFTATALFLLANGAPVSGPFA